MQGGDRRISGPSTVIQEWFNYCPPFWEEKKTVQFHLWFTLRSAVFLKTATVFGTVHSHSIFLIFMFFFSTWWFQIEKKQFKKQNLWMVESQVSSHFLKYIINWWFQKSGKLTSWGWYIVHPCFSHDASSTGNQDPLATKLRADVMEVRGTSGVSGRFPLVGCMVGGWFFSIGEKSMVYIGGGNWQLKDFWNFHPRSLGEMNPNWRSYFSKWVETTNT